MNYQSVDEIASTKGEILEGLGGEGLAIINADQPWLAQWIKQAGDARKVTFGLSEKADYRAINIQHQGLNGTQFDLIASLDGFARQPATCPEPCRSLMHSPP